VQSFGARLKKERERRKISLDEISVSTKIGVRFLRALEEEHFDQLPGGIFNKGFVRAYARYLGIDEEQAIADFLAASGAQQPEEKPEEQLEEIVPQAWRQAEGNGPARIPWGMFAVVLLIVAFGLAIWGFYSRNSRQHRTIAPTRPANVPASAGGTSRSDLKQSAPAESAPQVPPASQQPSSPTPGGQLAATPGAGVVAPQTSPKTSPAQTTVTAPGDFLVLIKAREDSWLAITADGKEVMQDFLAASAEKSVEARKEIVVRAGNIGALDFSFNGRKLALKGDYGEVKTLTFDANGLQPAPAKAQSATEQDPRP
jgi:cytoskeleton protein RodZ